MNHLLDRQFDERRRVIGVDHIDALRQRRLDRIHEIGHRFRGVDRIGAIGELDGEAGSRQAVIIGVELVVLLAELHPADIRERDCRTVLRRFQDDVLELHHVFELGRRNRGDAELLALDGGIAADIADGNLLVLRLDGV